MSSPYGWAVCFVGAAALAATLGAAIPAAAQGANPQLLSVSCAGCHGPQGRSPGPMPSLYGRTADSVAQILMEFKAGRRPATVMTRIAKGYGDDEIKSLSQEIARWK